MEIGGIRVELWITGPILLRKELRKTVFRMRIIGSIKIINILWRISNHNKKMTLSLTGYNKDFLMMIKQINSTNKIINRIYKIKKNS